MLRIATDESHRDSLEHDRLPVAARECRGVPVLPVLGGELPTGFLPERWLRTLWDFVERPNAFLRRTEDVESSGRSLWNRSVTVEWNYHKRYRIELGSRGIPVVPTGVPDRDGLEDAARQAIASFRVERIVVKPPVASGAEGLAIGDATVPALVEAARATKGHGGPVVPPSLPSVAEQGELSMRTRFDDVEISHAVAKVPKAGDVHVPRTPGGAYRRETPSDTVHPALRKGLEALPFRSLDARLDWLDWQMEPKLGEVEAIEPHRYWDFATECAEAFAGKLARQWPQ